MPRVPANLPRHNRCVTAGHACNGDNIVRPIRPLMAVTLVVAACAWMLFPAQLNAQGRRVRRGIARPPVVLSAYYRPLFYDPWYHPYGWYSPFAYAQFAAHDASLRLQVSPRDTEVFVDGYYAGTVDDFDGFFQRLHLEAGEHDIDLYLPGHRTARQKIYVPPSGTFRIRHTMEPLAAGEAQEPRPAGPPPGAGRAPGAPPRGTLPPRDAPASDFGTLAIRVQPGDADVLIDGDRWEGPAPDEQLVLQIAAGRHRLEIRREGYRTYSSEVDVRSGETATLNVSLPRQ